MRRLLLASFLNMLLSSAALGQAAPPAPPPAAPPSAPAAPPLALQPPVQPAWLQYRALELARIDARIAQLYEQRREFGIAGPIVMLGVGGGVLLIGGLISAVVGIGSDVDHLGLYTFVPVAAVSLSLMVTGGVLLGDRAGPRHALGSEIRALRQQRRALEWSIGPGPLSSRGGSLALRGSF